MNKTLLGILLTLGVASAQAMVIPFSITGWDVAFSGVGIGVTTFTSSAPQAAGLDDGNSTNFNAGTLEVPAALSAGTMTVTTYFNSPLTAGIGTAGGYAVASFFPIGFVGGWDGGSALFDYDYMGYVGQAQLDFDSVENGCFIICPSAFEFELTGTLTNLGSVAMVAEPASTLALLGLGILGLGLMRRKRRV